MTTAKIGLEGFFWWFGVVEDRNDPEKLGRVRVRVHNFHGTKTETPTADLQWAQVVLPPTSASLNKVGVSPTGIVVGSTVFGFFVDGAEGQLPIVLGTLPGIPDNDKSKHDVSLLARESNPINKTPIGPEPSSSYRALYPYNKVFQSESGHVIEIDDTPTHERIHIYHRKGSYTEINQEGRRTTKVVNDDIEVVVKDKKVYIEGNAEIEVKGNVNLTVGGNFVGSVSGNYNMNVGGDYSLRAGTAKVDASTINLNSGTRGAAREGDVADTADPGSSVGTNVIETGSKTVFIGG